MGVTMFNIIRLVFLFLLFSVFMSSAFAQEERNILDGLEKAKACKFMPNEALPNGDYPSIPAQKIIDVAIKGNNLAIPYSANQDYNLQDLVLAALVPCLSKKVNKEVAHGKSLEGLLQHCHAASWSRPFVPEKDRFKNKEGALSARRNLLRGFQAATTGGNDEALVVKRAWSEPDFEVLKKFGISLEDWGLASAEAAASSENVYVPVKSQMLDDAAIIAFFKSPNPPFSFYCRNSVHLDSNKKEIKARSYLASDIASGPKLLAAPVEKVVNDYDVVWGPARRLSKDFFDRSECAYSKSDTQSAASSPNPSDWTRSDKSGCKAPKAWRPIVSVSKLPTSDLGAYTQYERKSRIGVKFLESSTEFAKGDNASGLSLGTTLPQNADESKITNAGDTQFTAKAAMGLRFSREIKQKGYSYFKPSGSHAASDPAYKPCQVMPTPKDKPHAPETCLIIDRLESEKVRTFTLTPYVAANLNPQAFTFVGEDEDGDPALLKRNIDYAELTGGVRFDFSESLMEGSLLTKDIGTHIDMQTSGRSLPGWRWGLAAEGITDNYNLFSAERVAFDVSPPAAWLGSWKHTYRSPFPLDAFWDKREINSRPGKAWTWWDNAWAGIYLSWDAAFALEHLNYSRLPFEFEPDLTVDEFIAGGGLPFQEDVIEGGLFGADISVSLSKHDFLSIGKDDIFGTIKIAHTNRQEFDGGRPANRWEAELKLVDPTSKDRRFISFKYEDGKNYRTSQDLKDQFTFSLGYRY